MTTTVATATTDKDDCYGKMWEVDHPECAGGRNPLDPSRPHARCSMYEACGRTFRANETQKKLAAAQALINPAHLVRPQLPAHATSYQTAPVTQPQTPPAQPIAPQSNYYVRPAPHPTQSPQPSPQQVPTQHFYPAVYTPAQTLQPHEAAPFLTTLESDPDVPIWQRVVAEALRAGLKGVLQQGAFIVDHTPITRRKK